MEYTKQQIFEMGKELFVSNIVNEILKAQSSLSERLSGMKNQPCMVMAITP